MFKTDDYRVTFNYTRRSDKDNTPFAAFCIVYQDDKVIATGHAFCSKSDQFNKRVGRKLAFSRAIAGLPREERAMLWAAYWAKLRALPSGGE